MATEKTATADPFAYFLTADPVEFDSVKGGRPFGSSSNLTMTERREAEAREAALRKPVPAAEPKKTTPEAWVASLDPAMRQRVVDAALALDLNTTAEYDIESDSPLSYDELIAAVRDDDE